MDAAQGAVNTPLLRGKLHLASALLAPFALLGLLILADTPQGYVGASVFGIGLVLLFAASSANHLLPTRPRMHTVLNRLDHAVIFLFIAASYTPFCLALSLPWAATMLPLVWTLAITGAILRVAWLAMPRWLAVVTCTALGWLAIVAAPASLDALPAAAFILLLIGGCLFTLGGIAYGIRRPNPFPRVFGYHEVFHALVVAGTVVHYVAIAAFIVGA